MCPRKIPLDVVAVILVERLFTFYLIWVIFTLLTSVLFPNISTLSTYVQFPNKILDFKSLCVRGKSPLDVVAVIFCKESRSRGFGQQAFGSKPHSLLYSLLHIVPIPGNIIEWWKISDWILHLRHFDPILNTNHSQVQTCEALDYQPLDQSHTPYFTHYFP